MAWGLSHTVEAYEYADAQIRKLPRRVLEDCARAWRDELELPRRGFNPRKWDRDTLADWVSEKALDPDLGSCSNGGWALYVDPEGWTTVPFGPEDKED